MIFDRGRYQLQISYGLRRWALALGIGYDRGFYCRHLFILFLCFMIRITKFTWEE